MTATSDFLCLHDPGIILDEVEILLNVLLKKPNTSHSFSLRLDDVWQLAETDVGLEDKGCVAVTVVQGTDRISSRGIPAVAHAGPGSYQQAP